MGKADSVTISAYAFLVTVIILTCLEFSESCHRRVEYVHYYKKQPHKGHGHGHGGGGGHGHGGGYGGHKGGWHGGGGHHGGGYGHGGGHKGHGGGYGHGGGHKGHGGGYGHGDGYGHGGGGHHGGGYGHGGSHKGHGGGYGHGGGDHHGGGYGHGGGHKGHGGGGYGHDHKGYDDGGYGHGGGGHGDGHGHDSYGHYGGGHDDGYGHNDGHGGSGHGHDHGNNGHGKGRKYKYQMYEVTHYKDKGGHHQPSHGGGGSHYAQSAPHYTMKGYGYSGPYPNTEYSTPVETSVNAPMGPPNSFSDSISVLGDEDGRPLTQLDAADTADLIRNNAYDTKENELVHPQLSGNFGGGGGGHLLSDSSHSNSDYNSVDVLATPTIKLSSSSSAGNSRGDSDLTEMKVGPDVGNFDMNLNYNSDLPVPFRRNSFDAPNTFISGRRRKKISSKYRDSSQQGSIIGSPSSVLSHGEDADVSQSQPMPSGGPGPDYLENDTGDVGGSSVVTKISDPPDFSTMNF